MDYPVGGGELWVKTALRAGNRAWVSEILTAAQGFGRRDCGKPWS